MFDMRIRKPRSNLKTVDVWKRRVFWGKSLKCNPPIHLQPPQPGKAITAMWLTICLQGRNSATGMVHGTWHIISLTVWRTDMRKPCEMQIAMCWLLTVFLWMSYHGNIQLLVIECVGYILYFIYIIYIYLGPILVTSVWMFLIYIFEYI